AINLSHVKETRGYVKETINRIFRAIRIVFKRAWYKTGKKYALKSLNNNLYFDHETFKKFKHELELLHTIDHTNIIKFFGISRGVILRPYMSNVNGCITSFIDNIDQSAHQEPVIPSCSEDSIPLHLEVSIFPPTEDSAEDSISSNIEDPILSHIKDSIPSHPEDPISLHTDDSAPSYPEDSISSPIENSNPSPIDALILHLLRTLILHILTLFLHILRTLFLPKMSENLIFNDDNKDVNKSSVNRWKIFIAVFLGWTFEAFDYFIVSFALPHIASDIGVQPSDVAASFMIALAMRPIGALIFGILADRYGRKYPLIVNIVLCCIFGSVSGFAPNLYTFIALRDIFGIMIGGEWGIGAALLMENLPTKSRGLFSGIFQQGYSTGYIFAALLYYVTIDSLGWRAMFWISSSP
ncbi:1041_t:CDS:10, partial [Dentiscutata heterogama]